MSDPATVSPMTRADYENRELIRHLKKRKWRYLLIIIGFGAYSFYLFKFHLLDYTATASFLLNQHSIISSSTLDFKGFENISDGDNINRTYELINSAATQKHLIEKFQLMKHYGIDSTREFAVQKTQEILQSHIVIKKSPFNTIAVTVRDRYRYLAADMANEIVAYLETLNENLYVTNIQRKIRVSEAYLAQMQQYNTMSAQAIDSTIRKMGLILNSGKLTGNANLDLVLQQQKLNEIISDFKTASQELINSQKLYNLSLKALDFKSFPAITVIRNAMPSATSNLLRAALLSGGIMILTFMLLVFQAYLYIHYKQYIHMLFSEN